MTDQQLALEPVVRLACFLGVLCGMALWEVAAPRRRREIPRLLRWSNNLAVVVLDTVLVRLTFPIVAIGLAIVARDRGWGIFNVVGVPGWIAVVASVLVLDLAIYLQHVMFHAVPALWRLHRMHHADLEFDVSTGLRFHPLEIVLSMVIKLGVVAALGPPAVAVLVFEVLLNATSMFNHSNVDIPPAIDRILRRVVVTPDMHRVHHSVHPHETNSNFGFNLPWWDRLLGTYRAQPQDGHLAMTIGIEQFRTRRDLWIDRLLIQPFRGPASGYPINREGDTDRHA
jgi:sterol desaturase/sphingolipid hydroxylase (fatty acid hydroxylase superfamily)